MAFRFGDAPDLDDDFKTLGLSTSRLLDDEHDFDPFDGETRMSNVAASVVPAAWLKGAEG